MARLKSNKWLIFADSLLFISISSYHHDFCFRPRPTCKFIKRCAFRVRIGFANVREQLRFRFRSVLMSSYTLRVREHLRAFFLRARPRRRVKPDRNLKEPGAAIALQRSGFESPQLHQPAGAKFQRFAAVVTAPKTSGIAGSPLWFPDLDDGRVAVLPDISRARARPLARGGLSTKARSRSASRAEQTRLTSISELRQPAQAPGRRIASHFKLRALGLLPAPSASYGERHCRFHTLYGPARLRACDRPPA